MKGATRAKKISTSKGMAKNEMKAEANNITTILFTLSAGVTSGIVSATYFAAYSNSIWWPLILVLALFVMIIIFLLNFVGKKYGLKSLLFISVVIAIIITFVLTSAISGQKNDCRMVAEEINATLRNFSFPVSGSYTQINNCSCTSQVITTANTSCRILT